jgi:serine/threonine protein kinase
VRLALARGLCVHDEVAHCLRSREGSPKPGAMTLGETLVREGMLTQRQLDRLLAEVDAEGAKQQLPGYAVHKTVGKGAGGMVLKATQLNLNRPVAIKVLPRKLSLNPEAVESIYAEGRAAAKLNHPNIVQAYDVGRAGDCHFFVMEFVEGHTVHDLLRERERIDEESALAIMIPIADALRHAHERGLVHRDVKPRNIMITQLGVPKLADLGLARALGDEKVAREERGKILGTPLYISPEQIRGDEHIGPGADIYGLGATFYHMVAGRPPFEATKRAEVFDMHLNTPVEPPMSHAPELSEGVSELIEKMLAKDPGDRYPCCATLLTELQAWKALCVMRRGERGG